MSHRHSRLIGKLILEHVKCCFCEGPLNGRINLINIPKLATWKSPAAGNIFKPDDVKFACAVLCTQCIVKGKFPKFAVEWKGFEGEEGEEIEVIYHPTSELDDYILGS